MKKLRGNISYSKWWYGQSDSYVYYFYTCYLFQVERFTVSEIIIYLITLYQLSSEF